MRSMRRFGTIVAAAALIALAGACGDTDDGDDAADDSPSNTAAPDETTTTEGDSPGGDGATSGDTSLEFTAQDIEWASTEASAAAGDLQVTLTNGGQIEHSWLVEDHEEDLRLHVMANGDTDEGTISLEPGSYTYYCDIPGHRSAGMEGTLTVE